MRAVDTNVLVRLVTRDDPRQVAAAEAFVARGAWVPHVVLVEAIWVLISVYELEAPAVATAVEMLLNHRELTVQDGEAVVAALKQYAAQSPRTAERFGEVPEFKQRVGHSEGERWRCGGCPLSNQALA